MEIRSLLFVPSTERRLRKIGETNADAYIIDLEDSIDNREKKEALQRTIAFLKTNGSENVFVRINKDRCEEEVGGLISFNVGYMLPKFEAEDDYLIVEAFLKGRNVIALIESPRALMNIRSIASIPWVSALAFGAEDFTVSANMTNSYGNLFAVKSIISIAAKAYNKKVYDTPCFHIQDDDLLHTELQQAIDLGYDGKLAIHPRQIDEINKAFGFHDIAYLQHVVGVYDSAGKSVCDIDGVVYESFHISRFRRLIDEAKGK